MNDVNTNIQWPEWETVGLIGRGSFGAVYEIQRDVLGEIEKAALKVISIPQNSSDIDELYSDGYDEESITSTFKSHLKSIVAEYSLMKKMNSCVNIVNCEDVRYVQHEDGIGWDIFIKMELLTPLAKSLPNDIPEEMIVKIGADICRALEMCSKYEIVHRDIKPQNIFLSADGDYKLGDFGIAKTVEKTMCGTKIGTYKYMAPEVYNNRPYGTGADIYSLGLVLYWLLNERRMPFLPLPPEKLRTDMDEEARNRRFSGEAIPAPAYGSDALKAVVLKACAYNPADRFGSAQEMRLALEAALRGEGPDETERRRKEQEEQERLKREQEEQERLKREQEEKERLKREAEEQARIKKEQEEQEHIRREKERQEQLHKDQEKKNASESEQKNASSKKKAVGWILAAAGLIIAAVGMILIPKNKTAIDRNQSHDIAGTFFGETSEEISVFPLSRYSYTQGTQTIATDSFHTIAVREDGTVYAVTSNNKWNQCDVGGWTDIVAVEIDAWTTFGLKADGRVVVAGGNALYEKGPDEVLNWTDIVDIAIGSGFVAGLKSDGTVVITHENYATLVDWDGSELYSLVRPVLEKWESIISIEAGSEHIVGLKADGTVVCWYSYSLDDAMMNCGQHEVDSWTNIVAIEASEWNTYGLKSDGTVVAVGSNSGGQLNVDAWQNIVSVSGGLDYVVGLKEDGSVVAVGENEFGECNVEEWADIVAVDTASSHTVGLKADGTMIAVGNNYGECNIQNWTDVKFPKGLLENNGILVVNTSSNIRSGPGTDYDVITTADEGTIIRTVLGRTGDWYEVLYDGDMGYIREDLVNVVYSSTSEATSQEVASLELYKEYLIAYTNAAAPTIEERINAENAIRSCNTADELESCDYLTPMFGGEMILTFADWIAAGKPMADTSAMIW